MFVSRLFLLNPVYGGALYVTGLVWINYNSIFGIEFKSLDRKQKTIAFFLIPIIFLITVYLAIVYPIRFFNINIVFILAATVVVLLRTVVDRIVRTNIYRLLFYIALVIIYVPLVLIFSNGESLTAIPFGLVIGCFITYGKNIFKDYNNREKDSMEQPPVRKARNVNSYRLYANTVIVMTAALQIMVMMYVSYMRYVTKASLLGNLLNTYLITITAIIVLIAIAAFLQKKIRLEHYEKTLIFVIAAICWVVAGINIFSSGAALSSLSTYINIVVFIMGISFVFLILTAMQEDFKGIFSLDTANRGNRTVSRQMQLLDKQSIFVAYFTVMIMLTTLCVNSSHQSDVITNPGIYTRVVTFYMLVAPAAFVILGIIFSIRQPLSRKYSIKLRQFMENLKINKKNPHVEKQLIDVLVKKYKNHFGIKIVIMVLSALMKHTVEGEENIKDKNPAIFVCNHKEIYGPLVANLFIPFICRPWIINGMVDKHKIHDHLKNGFVKRGSKMPQFIIKLYYLTMSPILIWTMNSIEPIPVYRGEGRDIIKTINLTVEAMEQEDNVLIFPEDASKTDGYMKKPGEFFTGFAHIGKAYYKKTGKNITFYPMYADSEKKIIFMGSGIQYDNANNSADERDRIVNYLKEAMDNMAK